MKKIISAVMTLAMLLSIVAMAIPASASVDVVHNADYIDYVEAYYFTSAPKIDGVITTDEWGQPTVEVDSLNAATEGTRDPNKLFFHAVGNGGLDTTLSYKMWYRWNEQYFYIGVQVNDPDGHCNLMGRGDIWNGDAFQVRIDPEGPNAASEGETWGQGFTADNKPWSSDACDLLFGYTNLGGGFTEAFNSKTKTSLLSANGGIAPCLVAVVPSGTTYSNDSKAGITTYEIAIPWKYIEVGDLYGATKTFTEYSTSRNNRNYDGGIGREFGISALVYNSNSDITKPVGSHYWNCFLAWGSGVEGFQAGDGKDWPGVAPSTVGGSNSIVLSDEKVNSVPTNYTEGGIPDAESLPLNVPGVDSLVVYENLTYDTEDDLDVFGGFCGGTRVQDTDGNWVVKWDRWVNPSTGVDELQPNNYLQTESGEGIGGLEGAQSTEIWDYPLSFTFEFDIKVTGTETFQDNYDPALYDWFGSTTQVGYECGYYFNEGKFKVQQSVGRNDPKVILAEKTMDFSLNEWHKWRFQYDNTSCTMRFYFDGELLFSLFNKYFDYSIIHEEIPMIFRRMNVQCMMDNIRITNFVNYSPEDKPLPGDPSNPNPPSSTEEKEDAGATVVKDGNVYHVDVPVVAADAKATSLYFDAKFDSSKFTFKGVSGIDASAIKVEEMGDGYVRVTITDLSVVKALKAGDVLLRIDYEGKADVEITDDDVAALASGVTRVRVSPNTGDSMMLIAVVAATVMVMGTAIVVTRRKAEDAE